MWALCGSGGAGAREAACRAWWSGATRKVSDPRPAAGWGKGRTRYAQPGGTAAASGSGGARTAEAGRGRCIRRAPRRFSRGLAARGAFSAAAAGLCNGDLPSPSAMARPARPLTRWLAEAPRADWRRGPTFRTPMPPPVPRFSRGRLSAPLRPRGKLPLLHPRLAGRSAPRHSFVRAFGRLFTARRGVSAVAERGFFRSLSPPCPPPPPPLLSRHQTSLPLGPGIGVRISEDSFLCTYFALAPVAFNMQNTVFHLHTSPFHTSTHC